MTTPQEYRRVCSQCGTVWHSLVSRERQIEGSNKASGCNVCAQMCNPSAQLQASRNLEAGRSELTRLRQCPKCLSASYSEILITHEPPKIPR